MMTGSMMDLKTGEAYNVAAMTLSRPEKSAGLISGAAAAACGRFSHAARVLPRGECLGWQFAAVPGEMPRMAVFSSPGVTVTQDDFDWIFRDCAKTETIRRGFPESPDEEGRRVYALRIAAAAGERSEGRRGKWRDDDFDRFDGDDALPPGDDRSKALAALIREGAVLRFVVTAEGQGTILIGLPAGMSLRLRVMLSMAFEGTAAVEATAAAEIEPLPAAFVLESMTAALSALLWADAEQREEAEPDADGEEAMPEEGAAGAETAADGSAPIDDLDLSVRTYNCLKRAGVDTVDQLRALTGDELRQIRNLGRKCVEEIERKLSELPPLPVPAPLTAPGYADMLSELIGLRDVKEQIRKIAAFARMQKELAASGADRIPVVLNMEFVGNPGTAKTTVARLLAGMFRELGILSAGELVEVGRADLVARYEGQTADKVKTVFRKAKGRLLFIDEAYSLVESREGDFGDEAIDTIVQEMENNREDTVVIFAGYPDEMAEFFARNPGLRSRVPFRIVFSDYTPEEMVQIARLEAKKRGFAISPDADERLAAICAAAEPELGNGRFCRNAVESAILEYAARVYGGSEPAGHDFVLAPEDFALPAKSGPKKLPIGFRA